MFGTENLRQFQINYSNAVGDVDDIKKVCTTTTETRRKSSDNWHGQLAMN